jgi:hypothetical protein
VALDEACDGPSFCSFDAFVIAPANTGDEPSFPAAFDTEVVCTQKIIQA